MVLSIRHWMCYDHHDLEDYRYYQQNEDLSETMLIQKYQNNHRESPSYQIERIPISSDDWVSIQSFNDYSTTVCEFFKMIISLVCTDCIYFDTYCNCNRTHCPYRESRRSVLETRFQIDITDIDNARDHERRGLGMYETKCAIPEQQLMEFLLGDWNAIENYSKIFLPLYF